MFISEPPGLLVKKPHEMKFAEERVAVPQPTAAALQSSRRIPAEESLLLRRTPVFLSGWKKFASLELLVDP